MEEHPLSLYELNALVKRSRNVVPVYFICMGI